MWEANYYLYVDDLKISSVNEQAVMDIIGKLEERFGVMRKSFGKKHNYLGMEVEFNDDESVSFRVPVKKTNSVPAK